MFILIDIGVKFQDYCSDMTRTFFTAPPTPEQAKVYETVLTAQLAAQKALKTNLTGQKIDQIARQVIKQAGYEEKFTHSLGHGIGLYIHEFPSLSSKKKRLDRKINLQSNMIITLEPGIYLENKFGVRLEDMILIEGHKIKNLTRVSKKISDCIL